MHNQIKIEGTIDSEPYHNIILLHTIPYGTHLISPGFTPNRIITQNKPTIFEKSFVKTKR